jgi:beta-1,4-mannosyl-glycoprotein beta-1,4-N-acetylglucosaminyltransferase
MKVFDCFTFNNEFEILDIRLHELGPHVDKFIIAESSLTHAGKPKPLYLADELKNTGSWLHQFKDQLVVLDIALSSEQSAWERENMQRNGLHHVKSLAGETDLILVSDADEIPFIDFLIDADDYLNLGYECVVSRQLFYYYDFKHTKKEECHGTIALQKGTMDKLTFQQLRDKRFFMDDIESSGAHLSYFGTPRQVKSKIESFAHTEFADHADLDLITSRIKENKDIFGREGVEELVVVDSAWNNENIPEYIKQNKERYSHLL